MGDDPVKAAKVDELMDALEDVGATVFKTGAGLPAEEKEAARAAACAEGGAVYNLLDKLNKNMAADGRAVAGTDTTIADVLIFCSRRVSFLVYLMVYRPIPWNPLRTFRQFV